MRLFGTTVDSLICDIVDKIDALHVLAGKCQTKAQQKKDKVGKQLLEIQSLCHEGDRALGIAGRLKALVEG